MIQGRFRVSLRDFQPDQTARSVWSFCAIVLIVSESSFSLIGGRRFDKVSGRCVEAQSDAVVVVLMRSLRLSTMC
jgi:hypothetical protein